MGPRGAAGAPAAGGGPDSESSLKLSPGLVKVQPPAVLSRADSESESACRILRGGRGLLQSEPGPAPTLLQYSVAARPGQAWALKARAA